MQGFVAGVNWELFTGDCRNIMTMCMADNSVDSVVCDPPYELGFMGKSWDNTRIAYDVAMWKEVLRVLKPGGHLLSFGGSRTYHRMACAIEDAGFEIRDQIMWVYGSGFPKSMDVSKAIDKAAGAEREVVGQRADILQKQAADIRKIVESLNAGASDRNNGYVTASADVTAPSTPEAKQWNGWGTALKPAHEPIVMARKPLIGTVAANVLTHGTGALNIDASRVGEFVNTTPSGVDRRNAKLAEEGYRPSEYQMGETTPSGAVGRFPANLIHDGSDEVIAAFPANQPGGTSNGNATVNVAADGIVPLRRGTLVGRADTGSAARFFYCAKTSKSDRNEGCDDIEARQRLGVVALRDGGRESAPRSNNHPTVKPNSLMRYLVRMVTPPGGTVFDPFTGSGSTGKAAINEGFIFKGAELSADYSTIAAARIGGATKCA